MGWPRSTAPPGDLHSLTALSSSSTGARPALPATPSASGTFVLHMCPKVRIRWPYPVFVKRYFEIEFPISIWTKTSVAEINWKYPEMAEHVDKRAVTLKSPEISAFGSLLQHTWHFGTINHWLPSHRYIGNLWDCALVLHPLHNRSALHNKGVSVLKGTQMWMKFE